MTHCEEIQSVRPVAAFLLDALAIPEKSAIFSSFQPMSLRYDHLMSSIEPNQVYNCGVRTHHRVAEVADQVGWVAEERPSFVILNLERS